jgi:hypothetical protein
MINLEMKVVERLLLSCVERSCIDGFIDGRKVGLNVEKLFFSLPRLPKNKKIIYSRRQKH